MKVDNYDQERVEGERLAPTTVSEKCAVDA